MLLFNCVSYNRRIINLQLWDCVAAFRGKIKTLARNFIDEYNLNFKPPNSANMSKEDIKLYISQKINALIDDNGLFQENGKDLTVCILSILLSIFTYYAGLQKNF